MNNQIEILTEEASMDAFLRQLLPRLLPENYQLDVNCFIRPHEGKSHLMKSIPKKMKAYPNFPRRVKVLIIHDQVSNDCRVLKEEIIRVCNPQISTVVRIACRELENWFLGDFNAIEKVFPHIKAENYSKKAKFRNPDILTGSDEMKRLTQNFSKIDSAKKIGNIISIHENNSLSFKQFLIGLERVMNLP